LYAAAYNARASPAGDLLALNATLDRDPLRRERVRLGRALQRLRQLQPVQRPRLARIRVDPDVERLAQQRLQLRHVQHNRLTLGHSTIHAAHPTTQERLPREPVSLFTANPPTAATRPSARAPMAQLAAVLLVSEQAGYLSLGATFLDGK
jgi:hypothetical protein